MLSIFDSIRDLNILSITIRMVLSLVCGGMIGVEREFKRRPAGFRTHILICLGAAMTTLTGQYLFYYMNYFTDTTRLGAQVISGMGFIGAGTIITRREHVKGLTTAAGLWTSAIVGLAIGAGFYEGAILTTIMILVAEMAFSKIEYRIVQGGSEINYLMEYKGKESLEDVIKYFKDSGIKLTNLEITRSKTSEKHNATALFTIQASRKISSDKISLDVKEIDGVISFDEL